MCARHACSPLEALLVDSAFDADVYPDEPMRRHTMYRIGGPARFYVQVGSIGALKRLVAACQECAIPWVAVGRGSNLLVSDEGFPGVIIALGRDFRACRFDEETCSFIVGAGVPLSSVVQEAFRRSLSGLEFAVGTPGHRRRRRAHERRHPRAGDSGQGGLGHHVIAALGARAPRGGGYPMGLSLKLVRT